MFYVKLHLCTFKTPASRAVMSERGDADCAFKMRNGVKDAELQKLSIKLKGRYINVFIIMKKINSRGGFKWYGSTNHTVLDKWSDCFIELGTEFNRYNKNDIQYTGTYTNEGDVIIIDDVLHKPLDENSSEINALKKWYTIENVKVGSKFAVADIASDWALNSCSIM